MAVKHELNAEELDNVAGGFPGGAVNLPPILNKLGSRSPQPGDFEGDPAYQTYNAPHKSTGTKQKIPKPFKVGEHFDEFD